MKVTQYTDDPTTSHVCNIYMESEAMDSKEGKEGYVGGFECGERKREIM